jgi:hypothetical protein
MVPLGWALRAGGHEVFVVTAPEPGLTIGDMTSTGLAAAQAGDQVDIGKVAQQEASKVAPVAVLNDANRKAVQADYSRCDARVELEQMARIYPKAFSPRSMVDELIAFAQAWQPDLVLWDHVMMFAGPLIARTCGAANARFLYCPDCVAQLHLAFHDQHGGADPIEDALRARFAEYGFNDFDERTQFGDWTVNCMPDWTWKPPGMRYLAMRPMAYNGPSAVPDWLHRAPTSRRVCITLGLTSRGVHSSIPSIENLFKAASNLDVEVIATLSREHVADLDAIPDNVRAIDFVPMNVLLATCSAVLHHGGAGTVFSALEHGVPQVILPSNFANEKFWGQVAHAGALEEQGAGVYVDTSRPITAEELGDHLIRVLDDPSYERNAARLRAELLRLPAPGDIVPLLVELTAQHRTRT